MVFRVGVKDKTTLGAYSCEVYVPEPVVDVHQEEDDSRLLRGGWQFTLKIPMVTHLEVSGNFLFPLRNQSLGVATN